jgi:lipopolysaccharide export system permease protein
LVIYRLDSEGRFIGEPEYEEEKEIQLTDKPDDFLRQDFIVEAMSSDELSSYVDKFKGGADKITRRLMVELHYKKSYPFSTLVLTLIAIPFALMQNTAGKSASLGLAFGMGLVFYGINAVSLGLGKVGVIPPLIAAWLIPTIFSFLGILFLKKNPR